MQEIPKFRSLRLLGSTWLRKVNLPTQDSFKKAVAQTPNGNFVWSIQGRLRIRKRGVYRICTKSDDGSRLQIKHTKLVNNDGLHGPVEKCAEKRLTRGYHAIRATGFQAGGGAYMEVTYSGPDTKNKVRHMRVYRNNKHGKYYWGSNDQFNSWSWLIRHRYVCSHG